MEKIKTSVMIDSDEENNLVGDKSINILFRFPGNTLIKWLSKKPSSIQIVTFGVSFIALKRSIEEAVACKHYLRLFSATITKPIIMCEDNMNILINSTAPSSIL